MNELDIETRGLRKVFPGGSVALEGLDLAVPAGTVCGLLGRNGAGKTTLLRVLMGLLHADEGEALVLGGDLRTAEISVRVQVAYVAQIPRLVGHMSIAEHAELLAHFYPRFDRELAHALAGRFDVGWKRKFAALSSGSQRTAAVLLAVASRPRVLLLDEPAAGLDPIARRELIDVLIDLIGSEEGRTVLLSTHLVDDIERLAEHVVFVDAGRTVRADSLEALKRRVRRVQVVFEDGPPPGFAIPGAVRTECTGSVVTAIAELDSEEDLAPVLALPGVRVDLFGLGLEDLFIELVGPARGELDRASAGEGVTCS